MKHSAVIWQTSSDITNILQRKGLGYPDESPEVQMYLTQSDLVHDEDSYFPADFYTLAETLTPPFYGLAYLERIRDEDCLPTSLLVPLFNLRALEVLRQQASGTFAEYPVFVMQPAASGIRLASVRAMMADPEVKVAADGYALIKPLIHLDRTTSQASLRKDMIMLESEHEIPFLFRSGDALYVRDEVRRACEAAGLQGIEFKAALGLSELTTPENTIRTANS
ncbi:hypothetical protein [Deinococcus enclensis]|uniref:Uncharacterized protein n=1 Tax=Deinococcus enclensis TaxID=1049582 RepID=A0ABT9MFV8_9DEIO|nr:hypothetical protein [Deinococcus enclensis]MDP9765485.1 hypothetical protein [Deinococcus enclensis]